MVDWNPNTTGTKGLEWMPARAGVVTLDAVNKVAATSFTQTTSQATGFLRVPISALPTRGGLYVVTIFDNETGVPGAITALEAVPNEDVSNVGTGKGQWREQDNTTTTTIYSQIDEGSAAISTTDYIKNYSSGAGSGGELPYIGRMNTGSLTLTSKRIVSVALHVHIDSAEYVTVWAGLNISGVDYVTSPKTYYNNFIGEIAATPLYYNPSTKLPWTIADIQAFDTTDEWWVSSTSGTKTMRVHAAWLTIQIVDENRLAIGKLDDTASALTTGWNTVTSTTPTGGTWTKDGAGSHLYTVRRLNSIGAITIPYLEAEDTFASANGWTPTVDTTTGLFTAMGSATKRLNPFVQRTTAPADSVDSLPYRDLVDNEVYTGNDAEQRFSNAAAANYGLMRFLAKNTGTTADLLIKVKKHSDNSQVGGTATLTAAAFAALPEIVNGIKVVSISLASVAALLTATQYYIEFSSTAASSAACWVIPSLDTGDVGNTATFGGTTDRGTVDGSLADRYDIAATVSTVPSTPTGLAANLSAQALDGATICGVDEIPYIAVSWTATALGVGFAWYELARTEDGGTTWTTVARITVEATNSYDDYETPFGATVGYRIRESKTSGATSDWSATVNEAKPTPDCAALYMVSNYDPSYNVAYDYAPQKSWDFNEAADLVTVAVYGRDNVLGFLPTENRGATAHLTIKLGVDDMVPLGGGVGLDAFAPLRAIAHAPLPYVCLLDHYGVRMFAALSVPSGQNSEPASVYYADLSAIQVASEPFVA